MTSPSRLEVAIQEAALVFALQLVAIVRGIALDEAMAPPKAPARKARRDPAADVLTILRGSKNALTAEQIRKGGSLTKPQAAQALRRLVAEGKVAKSGRARGTRYEAL